MFKFCRQPVCYLYCVIRKQVNVETFLCVKASLHLSNLMASKDVKHRAPVCLDEILTWPEQTRQPDVQLPQCTIAKDGSYKVNSAINNKVSIYSGDISRLQIDAIVNAANSTLLGGGGVDGIIHRYAGPGLLEECKALGGCSPGKAKITKGHNLPAKYIIHTVGPTDQSPVTLANCYQNSLNLALLNGLKTIAFPCIATGAYGYRNERAAPVVLKTVREWLEINHEHVNRILFCTFLKEDTDIYLNYMQYFFNIGED